MEYAPPIGSCTLWKDYYRLVWMPLQKGLQISEVCVPRGIHLWGFERSKNSLKERYSMDKACGRVRRSKNRIEDCCKVNRVDRRSEG